MSILLSSGSDSWCLRSVLCCGCTIVDVSRWIVRTNCIGSSGSVSICAWQVLGAALESASAVTFSKPVKYCHCGRSSDKNCSCRVSRGMSLILPLMEKIYLIVFSLKFLFLKFQTKISVKKLLNILFSIKIENNISNSFFRGQFLFLLAFIN